MSEKYCPFCNLTPDRIIDESDYAVTIRDGFPVSNGHTLIILKRHLQPFFGDCRSGACGSDVLHENLQKGKIFNNYRSFHEQGL